MLVTKLIKLLIINFIFEKYFKFKFKFKILFFFIMINRAQSKVSFAIDDNIGVNIMN